MQQRSKLWLFILSAELLLFGCAEDECSRHADCEQGAACVGGSCMAQSNFSSTDPGYTPEVPNSGNIPNGTDTATGTNTATADTDTVGRDTETHTEVTPYHDTDSDTVFGCVTGTDVLAICRDFSEMDTAVSQQLHCDRFAAHGCVLASDCLLGCALSNIGFADSDPQSFDNIYFMSTDLSVAGTLQRSCIAEGGEPLVCD